MPKPFRILVVVIILVLVAGFGYLLLSDSSDQPEPTPASSQQQEAPSPQPEAQAEQSTASGTYTDYSAAAVANTQGQRILFFHAPWCPQCRQLDASIRAGDIPEGVTIFKVDYDSNQKLRQQYGVTIQTTLVLLDENGNEVKKYVAYDQPSLNAVIENLL